MSKPLPYFKWYPADAETDENFRAMTDAEIGFYVRCLNHSWMNGGLPADSEERARALREKQPYADRMWGRVGRCFELDATGRMVNKRQESERLKAIATSQNNKRVGNANAFKSRTEREPNGAQHALGRAESESESISENQEKDSLRETLERMYARHPKKKNYVLVYDALRRAKGHTALTDIEACHFAWSQTEDWMKHGVRFAPPLDQWLDDKGYTQWPPGHVKSKPIAKIRPYEKPTKPWEPGDPEPGVSNG